MFNFDQLQSVHLEITNRCQAACPMCSRNYHSGISNPNIKNNDWSIDDYKTIFSPELIKRLSSISMCGNFGDPIINDDLIDMISYTTEHNPSMEIQIHTNGGARKPDWWIKLAQTLPNNHHIHFAIDGLEDTHHIYRIGTTYDNVIKNAQAFIEAGGKAKWVFLKFKHNEHQVDEARRRAKDLGFDSFVLKNSTRFVGDTKFDVYDKSGNTIYQLEPASDTKLKFIDKSMIENYQSWLDKSEIVCHVQEIKQIYIDAYKNVYPCCYLGGTSYIYYKEDELLTPIRQKVREQMTSLISEFGTLDDIKALKNPLSKILNSEVWLNVWEKYWTINKLIVCVRTCGHIKTGDNFSKPKEQFIDIEDL